MSESAQVHGGAGSSKIEGSIMSGKCSHSRMAGSVDLCCAHGGGLGKLAVHQKRVLAAVKRNQAAVKVDDRQCLSASTDRRLHHAHRPGMSSPCMGHKNDAVHASILHQGVEPCSFAVMPATPKSRLQAAGSSRLRGEYTTRYTSEEELTAHFLLTSTAGQVDTADLKVSTHGLTLDGNRSSSEKDEINIIFRVLRRFISERGADSA
ncbi:unnamed protein product [Cutaneotrichosporon oleaginosum]